MLGARRRSHFLGNQRVGEDLSAWLRLCRPAPTAARSRPRVFELLAEFSIHVGDAQQHRPPYRPASAPSSRSRAISISMRRSVWNRTHSCSSVSTLRDRHRPPLTTATGRGHRPGSAERSALPGRQQINDSAIVAARPSRSAHRLDVAAIRRRKQSPFVDTSRGDVRRPVHDPRREGDRRKRPYRGEQDCPRHWSTQEVQK